ncbi:hypothetical protein [Sphingomonas sp. BK345]|nr:hypothetical protein [Sphingomonas sp. BK345]MBB3472040.1 hypothetical protein [Sphingomonas sp. BK345]
MAWFLAAQSSVGTRARDLTDLTVEQVKADVVAQLERWRLG